MNRKLRLGTPEMDHAQAIEQIQSAPFTENGWENMLRATSDAAGAWGGQVIVASTAGKLLFHAHHAIDMEAIAEFEALFADNLAGNPRAKVFNARPLMVHGDDDILPEESRRRHPMYAEFLNRVDAPYAGMALAAADRHARVLIVGVRHQNAGHIDTGARERFGDLLPHVASAIRLQQRLDLQAVAIAADALDSVSTPAFLLNAWGAVVGMTPGAEREVSTGSLVSLAQGRLRARAPDCDQRLQQAVERAIGWTGTLRARPGATSVLLTAAGRAVVAEVSPLPSGRGLGGGAVAVVALPKDGRSPESAVDLLRQCYRLSLAEAEVALAVSTGKPPLEVAADRGVRLHTVKNQLKSIFFKMGARSQAELAYLVGRLLG